MISLTINTTTVKLPSTRAELTPKMQAEVLPYLWPDTPLNREMCLYRIVGRRANRLHRELTKLRQAEPESDRVLKILNTLNHIFNPGIPIDRAEVVAPAIESFWHKGKKYYLPQPNLADVIEDFKMIHARQFGFTLDRTIILDNLRVRSKGLSDT